MRPEEQRDPGGQDLLRPLEDALRAISWSLVALAAGLAVARLA